MSIKLAFLRMLALCYALGFALHLLDLLSMRLRFSEMTPLWKAWIIFLTFFDFIAAVGLWKLRKWGVAAFLLVAASQLIAYLGFTSRFGEQTFLVGFHALSLLGFGIILISRRRAQSRLLKIRECPARNALI